MSGRMVALGLALALLMTACGTADSADDVAVLDQILVRHPHRASITLDTATDEFDVECTLANSSIRVVANSGEAVFSMNGRRDGSKLTLSGFSSRLPDGFSATGVDPESVDLSGEVLTGRIEGSPTDDFEQLSFRVDCRA